MKNNMKESKISYFGILLFFSLFWVGCSSEMTPSLNPSPTAFGSSNQIVVIADKNVWEGALGDTFRFYFSSAYPILPQPEPIFDLKHFTPEELDADPYRKELRTFLVLGNLQDPSSTTSAMIEKDLGAENIRRAKEDVSFHTTVGRDKWAKDQLLIYLFGPNENQLTENIKSSFPAIAKKVNQVDRKRIESTVYLSGENKNYSEEIRGKLGIDIRIPSDYAVAVDDQNFAWLRKETEFVSHNLMLYKIPYSNKEQLTKEGLKKIRDQLGKRYVSSELENTYMKINDIDLPMLTELVTISGNYAVEARGIWEIENDYMGGPFISYLILNEKTNELIFVDGFIFAPGKGKRKYMQYLEHIFSSIKIV